MPKKKVAEKNIKKKNTQKTKFQRGLSPKGGGKSCKSLKQKALTIRKNDVSDGMDVRRLSVVAAAKAFRQTPLGTGTSAAALRKQIKMGAPVNEDGTIDLIAWCAWILEQGEKEEIK